MNSTFSSDLWERISGVDIGMVQGILAQVKACFYVFLSRRGVLQ